MTAVFATTYNIADRLPCLERKRKLCKKHYYLVIYSRELLRLRY
ncbi:membrane protein [Bacillus phage Darren]|nr:membrane protein [Bacillus phage Darren]